MTLAPVYRLVLQICIALSLNLVCLPTTLGNWTYKSRPDLSPPTLNVTIHHASAVSTGYIFVAPYSGVSWDSPLPHGPLQPAPYIFTSSGDLVWSGFGYVSGWVTNFQAARWNNQDILFVFEGNRNTRHGHSHGHVQILDQSFKTIRELRAANHALLDLHEFHIVDEKTALVEVYKPVPYNLGEFGASPETQWIVDGRFQEIDIEKEELLFEWSSLDHIRPDESIAGISSLAFGTGYNSSDAVDYFHINSVDRDDQHNYLVSGRHTSTIYKINGTSGDILWRLGGKLSNFILGTGVKFGFQHHARFISQSEDDSFEIVSFFDNSEPHSGESVDIQNGESRGILLSLNTRTWKATLLQEYRSPDRIFAFSQGGTQVLPNGNVLVNWGSAGAVTEFLPNGTAVFQAYLDSGDLWQNGDVQNYRGFKYNWTGVPHEDPALVALKRGESIVLYVSWNGDTRTHRWTFHGVTVDGDEKLLGESKRVSFETSFYVDSGAEWFGFRAQAQDDKGEILRRSGVVGANQYIHQYVPGRDDVLGFESLQKVIVDSGDRNNIVAT